MHDEHTFQYTYSAPRNQEVLHIRSKYLPQEESKLELLRRLDREVRHSGAPAALSVGVVGCLIFGFGLCLSMEIIGSVMWLGTLLGLAGTVMMLAAYPVYRRCFSRAKAAYAPQILQLSAELMGEHSK